MTTRFNSFTVILEDDVSDDYAENFMAAIKMMRGVMKVDGNASSGSECIGALRENTRIKNKLLDLIKEL